MTRSASASDDPALPSKRCMPLPGVPGIIEGSMTMHPELGGGVSFRVIIGIGSGRTAKRDLLEVIISAEHVAEFSRLLAGHGAGITADSDPGLSFPCHIGFCRNAVSSAA